VHEARLFLLGLILYLGQCGLVTPLWPRWPCDPGGLVTSGLVTGGLVTGGPVTGGLVTGVLVTGGLVTGGLVTGGPVAL
jgi:hypothetical protein